MREIRESKIVSYPDAGALVRDKNRIFDALTTYERSLQDHKKTPKELTDSEPLERDKRIELETKLDNLGKALDGLAAPAIPPATAEGDYPEVGLPQELKDFKSQLQMISEELDAAREQSARSVYLYDHYREDG